MFFIPQYVVYNCNKKFVKLNPNICDNKNRSIFVSWFYKSYCFFQMPQPDQSALMYLLSSNTVK